MSLGIHSIATGSAGVSSFTLDAGFLIRRIANILRRQDFDDEILYWLNWVQKDIADKIRFPSLRTESIIPLLTSDTVAYYSYTLPANYNMMDKVYYRNDTDPAKLWGYNLEPIPREFFAGDTIDLERFINTDMPVLSHPKYYWITESAVPTINIYPSLPTSESGRLEVSYYKVPPDLTTQSDVPTIPPRLRHYMILLAVLWGKILLAQEVGELPIIGYWRNQYEKILSDVRKSVRKGENVIQKMPLPQVGLEQADKTY